MQLTDLEKMLFEMDDNIVSTTPQANASIQPIVTQ